MNANLAQRVIQELMKCGVKEICSCPGSRNAPLCMTLAEAPHFKVYTWPEERSAAYFAMGRAKKTHRPVAVVVTSGTAAAELLPAAIEAYYTGIPLILVTADRPRRMQGTGAPQTAEQVGIFSCYTPYAIDVEGEQVCDLSNWDQRAPAHMNVRFEEPQWQPLTLKNAAYDLKHRYYRKRLLGETSELDAFIESARYPLVIVSTLDPCTKQSVKQFLLAYNAPVFLEAISGLREDPDLQKLAVYCPDKLGQRAKECGYPIDGVLRIGGVPTLRFWRDLEMMPTVTVLSINDVPFRGLTSGKMLTTDIAEFFNRYSPKMMCSGEDAKGWIEVEKGMVEGLQQMIDGEPQAEAALVNALSTIIPKGSHVYLGNSLPIREWDLAATLEDRGYEIYANRGCLGIDGQLSTFLGLSDVEKENWAIVGDLTAFYDLVAPWVIGQMPEYRLTIVVINNGGGKIFTKLFTQQELLNLHDFDFEGFAKQWRLEYERWTVVSEYTQAGRPRIIEIVPDNAATARFNAKLAEGHTLQPAKTLTSP